MRVDGELGARGVLAPDPSLDPLVGLQPPVEAAAGAVGDGGVGGQVIVGDARAGGDDGGLPVAGAGVGAAHPRLGIALTVLDADQERLAARDVGGWSRAGG